MNIPGFNAESSMRVSGVYADKDRFPWSSKHRITPQGPIEYRVHEWSICGDWGCLYCKHGYDSVDCYSIWRS
jgi:hypothetical protein